MSGNDERREKVLIVDDDTSVREFIADVLRDDYACTAAASAEEALACCREGEYDLVLSDIQMKGMGGLDLIPRILELAPDTAVVMISGLQTVESAIQAMRAGAFDYVVKPFDVYHFEAAVRRALEHRSLIVAKRKYEEHLESLVAQRTGELAGAYGALEGAYRSTLKALTAALEARDQETHGHSERVVNFSLRLGRELGLDAEQMRSLEFGSLLHDIGKIGVPDAILRKPARLTDEEWVKMREHPLHGSGILNGIDFLAGASRVVAQHHEKWDGSGYPLGLRGEEIDLNARIFAVADAFDAITSDRVYRRGRTYEAAVDELNRCAGTHFDPRVVEAFVRVPRHDWDALRRRRKATAHGAAHPEPRRLRARPARPRVPAAPDTPRRGGGAARPASRRDAPAPRGGER